MAYRPSQRRTLDEEPAEPNLTPIMNLMVVLIPLLLSSAEYIKLGAIELNLPPAIGPLQATELVKTERKNRSEITISVTENFIQIDWKGQVGELLAGQKFEIDQNGEHLERLNSFLWQLKNNLSPDFIDRDEVILQPVGSINYQTLIDIMDAVRSHKSGEETFDLFPNVKLSAGII